MRVGPYYISLDPGLPHTALREPTMIQNLIRFLSHDLDPTLNLWTVDLDQYADSVTLDGLPAEDQRRARPLAPVDGRRLLARRHAVRELLARASGVAPASLQIAYHPSRKPHLGPSGPSFNMSHSGSTALIGIRRAGPVGLDLERRRPIPENEGIVRNSFTEEEREEWHRATPRHRLDTFLRCWTRKEACAKALGLGVRIPFNRIAVGTEPGRTVARISMGSFECALIVVSLDPGDDLVGAAALADPVTARQAMIAAPSGGRAGNWLI